MWAFPGFFGMDIWFVGVKFSLARLVNPGGIWKLQASREADESHGVETPFMGGGHLSQVVEAKRCG